MKKCDGQCGKLHHPDELGSCAFCEALFCDRCNPLCVCQRAISALDEEGWTPSMEGAQTLLSRISSVYGAVFGRPTLLGVVAGREDSSIENAPAILAIAV